MGKSYGLTVQSVTDAMVELGVYKKEFDTSIKRYVELSAEYKKIYGRYKKEGYQCTIGSATGEKKNPVVSVLEKLRCDILALENALGLTPGGLLKLKDNAFDKKKEQKSLI